MVFCLAAASAAASGPGGDWLPPDDRYAALPPPGKTKLEQLRRLLADRHGSARLACQRDGAIVLVDLQTLKPTTVRQFPKAQGWGGLSRPWWSRDGSQVVFSYRGQCYVAGADGKGLREVLRGTAVHEPSFWDDPADGQRCIVYNTDAGKFDYPDDVGKARTLLYRPKTKATEELADFPFDAGLSLDGLFLAEGYPRLLIKAMRTGKIDPVRTEGLACHASLGPDDTCRIMYLTHSHGAFGIVSRFGEPLWYILPPPPSRLWHTPRFSTHPGFCTAVAQVGRLHKVVVIRIATKQAVVLDEMDGNWLCPHLYVTPPTYLANSIDRRKLGAYAARAAEAAGYAALIRELQASPDREARAFAEKLVDEGRSRLGKAARAPDPLVAQAIYRELAERYADHPIGRQAYERLDSPRLKRWLEARRKLGRLEDLRRRIRPVPGRRSAFADPAFFERNRAVLVQMVKLAADIGRNYADLPENNRAQFVAFQLLLPQETDEPGNVKLVVDARAVAVSRPPTLQEIAPYDSAVLYARWRVEKVLSGRYAEKELLAVHWAIRDRRPAAGASLKAGARRRLTVDLFDAHPELADVPASQDADNFELPPHWVLEADAPPAESQPNRP